MHQLYKTEFLYCNQFWFIPHKSTTNAAMTVKQFLGPELERRRVVIMISLDLKGAFEAAAGRRYCEDWGKPNAPGTFTN